MNTEGKAKETANSRDGLDDYIRVSSPGVTADIITLTVIVAAVIAWGLIARVLLIARRLVSWRVGQADATTIEGVVHHL